MPIVYRDLTSLAEFRRVVELEKEVWGYTDAEDVVPVPILAVSVKRGGVLVGAFEESGRMVGFVYSLPALKDGRPMQWSHMLGVTEPYRRHGVGVQLKLEQRLRALAQGIDLIEWTFDPLQAANAHLNFNRLGIVVEEYEVNIYGESSSLLHRGAPTDRFVAKWRIRTPRVEGRLAGNAGPVADMTVPRVNRVQRAGSWVECEPPDLSLDAAVVAVEIPMGFSAMLAQRPELAHDWRMATRQVFTTYFERGYLAAEFALSPENGVGRYLLSRERL